MTPRSRMSREELPTRTVTWPPGVTQRWVPLSQYASDRWSSATVPSAISPRPSEVVHAAGRKYDRRRPSPSSWHRGRPQPRRPVPLWVGGLAHLDQMTVGIADIATNLVLVLLRRRQELGTPGAPLGVHGLNVCDPDI